MMKLSLLYELPLVLRVLSHELLLELLLSLQ